MASILVNVVLSDPPDIRDEYCIGLTARDGSILTIKFLLRLNVRVLYQSQDYTSSILSLGDLVLLEICCYL